MTQLITRFTSAFRWLLISALTINLGLLFVQLTGSTPATADVRSAEKVNLALRRVAHHLLRAAGDSTSRIAAVQPIDQRTYRLRLDHAFDYDRLPGLLQASFLRHHITGTYDVAVLDCTTGTLELGYTVDDLTGDRVPCGGRSMKKGCYVLQITFATPSPALPHSISWPLFALVGVLTGLLALVWRQPSPTVIPEAASPTASELPNQLFFGHSSLDITNQLLLSGPDKQHLTYREAKLLRVLASHPNQLLERDQILKLVWEDEGITVGRSVDVFISRLRKLLSHDPTVRIVAVHGVGYRMEVV